MKIERQGQEPLCGGYLLSESGHEKTASQGGLMVLLESAFSRSSTFYALANAGYGQLCGKIT